MHFQINPLSIVLLLVIGLVASSCATHQSSKLTLAPATDDEAIQLQTKQQSNSPGMSTTTYLIIAVVVLAAGLIIPALIVD